MQDVEQITEYYTYTLLISQNLSVAIHVESEPLMRSYITGCSGSQLLPPSICVSRAGGRIIHHDSVNRVIASLRVVALHKLLANADRDTCDSNHSHQNSSTPR